jgi:hypothetical protein
MRSLPAGIDRRSPARHPDWLGPDDLSLKIQEIREATDYQVPILGEAPALIRARADPAVAGAVTPVPGGVGPMTIAMLLRNTVTAARPAQRARAAA